MAWLPNLLTCLRILLTPAIVWALLSGRCDLALPLSMIAGSTDGADGLIARRFGWTSRLGRFLDPIADKILLTSLYVSFGLAGLIPIWLVWLVVGRDAVILGLSAAGLMLTSIRDFPPTNWGKLSTLLQISGALIVLAACSGFELAERLVPVAILAVAAGTAWSGIHYIWRAECLFGAAREKV